MPAVCGWPHRALLQQSRGHIRQVHAHAERFSFTWMLVCRSSQAANAARSIADTVQCFITAMDSLKLGMSAVDEVDAWVSCWPDSHVHQRRGLATCLFACLFACLIMHCANLTLTAHVPLQIHPLLTDLLNSLHKVRGACLCCVSPVQVYGAMLLLPSRGRRVRRSNAFK